MSFPVNAELVAIHWLKGIEGLPTDKIAAITPEPSKYATTGFVRATVVGGVPNAYTFMQNSLVQIDCFAYNANSDKAPWGKANTLAETIKRAIESPARDVTTPGEFEDAHVHEVIVVTDPRRVPDEDGVARFQMDVRMHWTRRA